MQPFRVAVIIGSVREGRFGPKVAAWFRGRAAGRAAVTVDLVDLVDLAEPAEPAGRATALSRRLAEADAFVVVTPEYNHSFPGPLKQAIDAHHREWHAKPVGFVSYGGISGGLRAVEQLRVVFAELHAVTVRDTVSFHNAGALFDDEGRLIEPDAANAAAKTLLDQLLWWARALRDAKAAHLYAA
jgi:NAD(P)H-dependent FMN reductase